MKVSISWTLTRFPAPPSCKTLPERWFALLIILHCFSPTILESPTPPQLPIQICTMRIDRILRMQYYVSKQNFSDIWGRANIIHYRSKNRLATLCQELIWKKAYLLDPISHLSKRQTLARMTLCICNYFWLLQPPSLKTPRQSQIPNCNMHLWGCPRMCHYASKQNFGDIGSRANFTHYYHSKSRCEMLH